jgi:hypothetical protein
LRATVTLLRAGLVPAQIVLADRVVGLLLSILRQPKV